MSIQQPKPHNFDLLRDSYIAEVPAAPPKKIKLSPATREAVDAELLTRARNYCPEQFSCRQFKINPLGVKFIGGVSVVIALGYLFPLTYLVIAMSWILLLNMAVTALRVSAIIAMKRRKPIPSFLSDTTSNDMQAPPRVTILVPLFRESKILPILIENLKALDYPQEFLEIKLLLEQVDTVTNDALKNLTLPPFIDVLTIPKDWLQTKPKAMNYALPFCTGDIIGIYDAEDRPEPDQIRKVVKHFKLAPANVACVQGTLDFFNSRDNWMARCFTIDYAMWFQVLLRGVQTLGIPIPLGGTTIFFRRHILIEIGGWDAHNVTEDAELGMRLARFGYRCEMLDSTTWEEATCAPISWIRQRSRWLKGYAMTWASHMRAPVKLWHELGAAGFVGFQIIMLAGLTSYLAAPLFVALWFSVFGWDIVPVSELPNWFWISFITAMIVGELVMFVIAAMAVATKGKRHLLPYIVSLPFYWLLGAIASYKAAIEVVFAPFYWDKTSHGHTKTVQTLPASDLSRIS